jgi:hypothetical protein
MNAIDQETTAQDDRDRANPATAYIDVNFEPIKPTRQLLMTIDQIYALGFRIVVGLCLGFLFLVAAIYYQVINP